MKLQMSTVFKILFQPPYSDIDAESFAVTLRIPETMGPNLRQRNSISPEGFCGSSMGNYGKVS